MIEAGNASAIAVTTIGPIDGVEVCWLNYVAGTSDLPPRAFIRLAREVATKIDSWAAVFKEINFMYALAYGQVGLRTDYEFAIDMMASGRLPLQKLITHQVPLENIREAFELADDKTRGAFKVVVRP